MDNLTVQNVIIDDHIFSILVNGDLNNLDDLDIVIASKEMYDIDATKAFNNKFNTKIDFQEVEEEDIRDGYYESVFNIKDPCAVAHLYGVDTNHPVVRYALIVANY